MARFDRPVVAIAMMASASIAATAAAQQFVEESTQRFPQPDPLEWTNQVSLADINGDGAIDVIFANGGNFSSPGTPQKVRILINDGSGFFTDETDARTGGLAGRFRGVEFGDMDNDGDLDMILAADFNARPKLLTNDGNGFFTDESNDRIPGIPLSSSRAQFFDIDNDGDLDIYFVSGGSVSRFGCGLSRVYINDGNGFFTDATASLHPGSTVCGPMDATVGDYTGDFWLDVRVAALGSNNSRMFYNDGAGALFNASSNLPGDSTCYSYDAGDINGNGMLDLLGANAGPGSTSLLLENNGDGTFSNVSGQISPNPSVDDNDSKFLDFDNDGDMDLVIGRLGGTSERVYENDGNGNFTQVPIITSISDSTLDIVVGDLTGNGKLDIVTGQGESGNYRNRIYINNGPSDTLPPRIISTEQLDDTDDTAGPYAVRASILDDMSSDRNFFDKGVFLNYTVDGGDLQQVAMRWSGGQIYRGEIPGQNGGVIEYFVTAIDFADNEGTGDALSFTVTGGKVLGDLDGNGVVDGADLSILLAAWGPCDDCDDCDADLNGGCQVDASDLALLLGNWG